MPPGKNNQNGEQRIFIFHSRSSPSHESWVDETEAKYMTADFDYLKDVKESKYNIITFGATDEISKSLLASENKILIEDLIVGCGEEPNTNIENINPMNFSTTQTYEQTWQTRKGEKENKSRC